MKTKLFLCLIVLAADLAPAEIIKGGARLRNRADHEVVLSLKDGVRVFADPLRGDYYDVFVIAIVDSSSVEKTPQGNIVKAGTKLWTKSGSLAGTVLSDLPAELSRPLPSGRVQLVFYDLQVHRKFIDPNSDPERSLPALIASGATHRDQFARHLLLCDYHLWSDSSGFRVYLTTGADVIGSPMPRLFLVFYHDQLFAIMSPSGIRVAHEIRHARVREFRVSYAIADQQAVKRFESIYFDVLRHAD